MMIIGSSPDTRAPGIDTDNSLPQAHRYRIDKETTGYLLFRVLLIKNFFFFVFFDNLGCPGQRSVDMRISTNPRGHATPY